MFSIKHMYTKTKKNCTKLLLSILHKVDPTTSCGFIYNYLSNIFEFSFAKSEKLWKI